MSLFTRATVNWQINICVESPYCETINLLSRYVGFFGSKVQNLQDGQRYTIVV